jgi:hypothetical protein
MVHILSPPPSSYGSYGVSFLLDTRRELGAITYAPNVLGSRGPRKMQVLSSHPLCYEIILIVMGLGCGPRS